VEDCGSIATNGCFRHGTYQVFRAETVSEVLEGLEVAMLHLVEGRLFKQMI
jgi:hypothetical protein